MRTRADNAAGFSLIEMMIAVAIMGVVTAQLFVVFANQKRVYMSNERAVDVQETSRLTLDMISFDTRMAGYMVADYAAVSSFDGGADHADRLCVSTASSKSKDTAAIESMVKPWKGARVTSVSANSVTIETEDPSGVYAASDFDMDGFDDFTANAGVIIATDQKTYCVRIAAVTPTSIIFAQPAGEDALAILGAAPPFGPTDMRAVPATIYELDEDPDKLELRRNTLLLANQIEDFQVEFWVDNAGFANNGLEDGDTEFPVNDLNDPDPPNPGMIAANDLIRRVRVSVAARTNREEGSASAAGHRLGGRPALANRIASDDEDSFRRRSFSASILPRNVSTLINQD